METTTQVQSTTNEKPISYMTIEGYKRDKGISKLEFAKNSSNGNINCQDEFGNYHNTKQAIDLTKPLRVNVYENGSICISNAIEKEILLTV